MSNIFAAADTYIERLFHNKDKGFADIEKSIKESEIQDMSISPNQGRLLSVLAKLCNAKQILEIGTFLGYSACWLARSLPEGGLLTTIEFDETHAEIAIKNMANAGLTNNVMIHRGMALDVLAMLESEGAGPYDMIFIDADKPPYAEYFQWALKLSRPGTLIVADHVIRHVFDANTLEEKKAGVERFNKFISECTAVTATIIQNVGIKEHDGMAIAVVN